MKLLQQQWYFTRSLINYLEHTWQCIVYLNVALGQSIKAHLWLMHYVNSTFIDPPSCYIKTRNHCKVCYNYYILHDQIYILPGCHILCTQNISIAIVTESTTIPGNWEVINQYITANIWNTAHSNNMVTNYNIVFTNYIYISHVHVHMYTNN